MVTVQYIFVTVVGLHIVCAVMLVACCTTHRWLYVTCDNRSQDYSLWYITLCDIDSVQCDTWSYGYLFGELQHTTIDTKNSSKDGHQRRLTTELRLSKNQVTASQIEISIALVLNFLALVLVTQLALRYKQISSNRHQAFRVPRTSMCLYWLALASICATSTLVAVPLSRFASTHFTLTAIFDTHAQYNCDTATPYSLILLSICVAADITTVLVSSVLVCKRLCGESPSPDDGEAITIDTERDVAHVNGNTDMCGEHMIALVPKQPQQTITPYMDDMAVKAGYVDPVQPAYDVTSAQPLTS